MSERLGMIPQDVVQQDTDFINDTTVSILEICEPQLEIADYLSHYLH